METNSGLWPNIGEQTKTVQPALFPMVLHWLWLRGEIPITLIKFSKLLLKFYIIERRDKRHESVGCIDLISEPYFIIPLSEGQLTATPPRTDTRAQLSADIRGIQPAILISYSQL